jgi:hypothetical protein
VSDHVTNILTEILAVVRDERRKVAAVYQKQGYAPNPKPSPVAEAKIRQALVDLAIASREDVLYRLFPEVTEPTGTNMDPMKTKDLRCRCGVCRPCWERELVASARESRDPMRPEVML